MDTLLQQAQSIATAAKKLSLEIKATETTKPTIATEKQIMLELAGLAIDNQHRYLYLSVDLAANSFVSSVDVYSCGSFGHLDGAKCRFVARVDSPTFLADLLAYQDKVLANIELAKQQQRLAEEQYA